MEPSKHDETQPQFTAAQGKLSSKAATITPLHTRARSNTVIRDSNPIETPLTIEEIHLTRLVQTINADNEREVKRAKLEAAKSAESEQSDSYFKLKGDLEKEQKQREIAALSASVPALRPSSFRPHLSISEQVERRAQELVLKQTVIRTNKHYGHPQSGRVEGRALASNMNYHNYLDSPAGGSGSNPRQAPPSPSQNMNHANGINGGVMGIGGMVGFPTPAGHQSDLNYIMGMVEELSRQLEHNQRLTSGVVEKIGKVREKAQNIDLNNDELIALVAAELNEDTKNIEKECSELRKKLERAEYNRDENWKLAIHGCNILSDILEKMHKYKEQHETDTLTWHKNYRKQLSDEREENLALRNQINDMRAAACRANEWLRKLRRAIFDNDEMTELRIQNIALRQEKRYWKRMALPLIPDDDSEWSDDDDLIDPEEKKRQAAEAAEKERKEKEGEGGSEQAMIT